MRRTFFLMLGVLALALVFSLGTQSAAAQESAADTAVTDSNGDSVLCELTVSDDEIIAGEDITLTWETRRTTDVTIVDSRGGLILSTKELLSADKEELLDGSITVTPVGNTTYRLIAERGSQDEECVVAVDVADQIVVAEVQTETDTTTAIPSIISTTPDTPVVQATAVAETQDDEIVIIETREQQPLVAEIELTEVPDTGFEAGPIMTVVFYVLVAGWAFYLSYFMVIRGRTPAPVGPTPTTEDMLTQAAETKAAAFTQSPATTEPSVTVPNNLPTVQSTAGYPPKTADDSAEQITESEVIALENLAHGLKGLLSSDAIRHFVSKTSTVDRADALTEVITEAKKKYPLEDNWIVINEARMRDLCVVCQLNHRDRAAEPFTPTVIPEGSSSLAEAIISGNIVAAYDLVGNRPMFSLADAAADLDAVYRNRNGATETVSDLLTELTAELSDDQLKATITALTKALDGTYTSEEEAVKMAIMKAVKASA